MTVVRAYGFKCNSKILRTPREKMRGCTCGVLHLHIIYIVVWWSGRVGRRKCRGMPIYFSDLQHNHLPDTREMKKNIHIYEIRSEILCILLYNIGTPHATVCMHTDILFRSVCVCALVKCARLNYYNDILLRLHECVCACVWSAG